MHTKKILELIIGLPQTQKKEKEKSNCNPSTINKFHSLID
jgi:hypothetical protein